MLENLRTLAGIAAVAAIGASRRKAFPPSAQDAGAKVVVKVNGKQITEADMKLAEGEIGTELANLPPEVRRRALAEYLIDNQLFANAAEASQARRHARVREAAGYLRERALREQYFEKTLKGSVSERRGQEDLQRTRRRDEA